MSTTYYAHTNPHKLYRTYNPELFSFLCYYGSRCTRVRAEGRFTARQKGATYFNTSPDKITVVRA